jgi:hypothetical protein
LTTFTTAIRLALITVALLIFTTACAFPEQGTASTDQIEGTYYVNGVDGRGIEYGGRLEITPGDGSDHYAMQWIITGSIQIGTGVRDGDVLEAEWSTVEGLVNQEGTDRSYGTVTYTIASDGSLDGTRTIAGQTEVGTEEAFPVKP